MARMSLKTGMVFMSLRQNVESVFYENDTGTWGNVYLDNALPQGMTPRAFAGHLASLQKLGLYRSNGDDCFGDVLMDGEFVVKGAGFELFQ